jgi:hypothetical protein
MARQSSSSIVLVTIVLLLTFPIWISIAAVVFGLAAGMFGLIFGLIAGLFGIVIGIIAFPFKLIFGWNDWGWHPFHFGIYSDGWFIVAVVVLIAIVLRKI